MIDRVVLASNNKGKLAELQAMFAPLGIALVPQGELGVPEAEEPHRTFVENALATTDEWSHGEMIGKPAKPAWSPGETGKLKPSWRRSAGWLR